MSKSGNQKIILRSSCSPEECYKRLKASVDTSFFMRDTSKKVIGAVSRSSFWFRKRISYRNSFQTVLKASLKQAVNGTELTVTTGLYPTTKWFMIFWLGIVVLVAVFQLSLTVASFFIKEAPKDIGSIIGKLIPVALAIAGFAILKFGRYLARNESDFLKAFLIDLLEAQEVNQGG
jgi:hypothetical protein